MTERTVSLAELVEENQIEVGAGRPRSVPQGQDPLPILRVADVLDGKIESLDSISSSDFHSQDLGPKVSRPGDIVLTVKGTVGRVALMPIEGPRFAYSPQLCYFRPRVTGPLVARYLYYWFKSADFWIQANALKGQTDMADFISLGDILSLKLRLPSRAQQEDVVSVLGALDDKIAVNEHITATASELAAVHYLATPERELVKITDVAQVTMGQSPPGETFNEQGIGLPFYQGTRDFGFRFPGYRVWCTAVTRQAEENNVLVSVRAPVGQINVAAELCGIGRGLASVRSEKYPRVLLQALSADESIWLPYEAEGTVFGSINKKQFTQLEIGWPTSEFIDYLESQLSALDQRIRRATEESRTLAALRDTLLPQLMSGKLQVRDAEKIVEDAV
ncbi:restriction endonuclease subunit S [Streptomyces sp. NPDC057521]|uniref:restriction endonuclease subunit S n=1 Tax=Streptomyces sp. NPDC057521 TaxID=3346156 RepID=UPI003691F8E7